MLGGGTVMPQWHGVAVLTVWVETAGICKEVCLWAVLWLHVWECVWGWKVNQEGSLSSDTTCCILASLMQGFTKGNQECIGVQLKGKEVKEIRTKINTSGLARVI